MTEDRVEDLIYMILRLEGRPLTLAEVVDRLPTDARYVYNQRKSLLTSLKDKGKVGFVVYDGFVVKWQVSK
jgi:hypothetical protein